MKLFRNSSFISKVAFSLAIVMLIEAINPGNMVMALTSGPLSPEFSSFEPVATTNMVNPLTGGFTYNIPILKVPGPHGSGYGLSLSYHSGNAIEQEASWVGFGWTLNPGVINRSKRGFADDANGDGITYYAKAVPSVTCSITPKSNVETLSNDNLGFSVSRTLQYNNYQGMSEINDFGVSLGLMNFGIHHDGIETTFSASINPMVLLDVLDDSAPLRSLEQVKAEDLAAVRAQNRKQAGINLRNRLLSAITQINFYSSSTQPHLSPILKTKGLVVKHLSTIQPTLTPLNIGFETGVSGSISYIKNIPKIERSITGYLREPYSTSMKDYYLEKDSRYTPQDIFISPAFNNYDYFNVSGEFNAGSFRGYQPSAMSYCPEEGAKLSNSNEITIYNSGLDLMLGDHVGVGIDFGTGKHTQQIKKWVATDEVLRNGPSRTPFYRFLNDPGGKVRYTDNADYEEVALKNDPEVLANFIPEKINTRNASELRSIYIKEITKNASTADKYIDDDAYSGGREDKIRAFLIVNPNGQQAVYGYPVFCRNEKSIQIGTEKMRIENQALAIAPGIEEDDVNDQRIYRYSGQFDETAYANIFLLTQLLGSNYVDIDNNGISEADLGAWTRFCYRKKYSLDSDPYLWRTPYNGLLYEKNLISDPLDDVGFFSKGEKEVVYLKAVETATHIAFFVTNNTLSEDFDEHIPMGVDQREEVLAYLKGSGEVRYDGLGASQNACHSLHEKDESAQLDKLERIILYSKNDFSKPLQETFFEYSHELGRMLPNSIGGNNHPTGISYTQQSGKLTLKRVWTEYKGIKNTKISPYNFEYFYKTDYTEDLLGMYGPHINEIVGYGTTYSSLTQNPDYDARLLDGWGNIQYDAVTRHKNMQPWVYQGDIPENEFDPAAWQLKRISLPSGGEINIQYEQANYSSVQDRCPMSMISLLDYDEPLGDNPTYTINPEDVGIDLNDNEACEKLYEAIYDYFITKKNKIFFKFLYGFYYTKPAIDNDKSEYISGYTNVDDVRIDNETNRITIVLTRGTSEEPIETPRKTSHRFFRTHLKGKIQHEHNQTPFDKYILRNRKEKLNYDVVLGLYLQKFLPMILGDALSFADDTDFTFLTEDRLNPSFSYLKIPMIKDKKGGGIRVKRLLFYDEGLEKGRPTLSGTAYHYVLENGRSSGVADNEPGGKTKIENALVEFLPKKKQHLYDRLVSGKNLKVLENPIAESLLPSPVVYYARVIQQSIHNVVSKSGYTITEYYTTKDFPYDANYPLMDEPKGISRSNLVPDTEQYVKQKINLNLGVFQLFRDFRWMTQGYRFIQYQISGKEKRRSSCIGYYNPDLNNTAPSSSFTAYEYTVPGENMTMWDGFSNPYSDIPGIEEDFTVFNRSMEEKSNDFGVQIDVGSGFAGILPIPGFSLFPNIAIRKVKFNMLSSTKVLQIPPYLKKTTTFQDGIFMTTENLAFNPHTGQPIVVRTSDPFVKRTMESSENHGYWYHTSIPACSVEAYTEMGQIANRRTNTNQLLSVAQEVVTYGHNPLENPENPFDNVVSSSVQTYKKDWQLDVYEKDEYGVNAYTNEMIYQSYFPWQSYSYNDELESILGSETARIYAAGYTREPLSSFNYEQGVQNPKWKLLEEITKYSPHGEPLESKNILNIYSANKYNHSKNLISISGVNCHASSLYFEDFESENNAFTTTLEQSHTGMFSHKVKDTDLMLCGKYRSHNMVEGDSLSIKFWLKTPYDNKIVVRYETEDQIIDRKPMTVEAYVNGWYLYSGYLTNVASTQHASVCIKLNHILETYIDDIRIVPAKSMGRTFVYNPNTFELVAQMDDQHFALIYQYDGEGKLIRKEIETSRGVNAIQENHYNQKGTLREK